MSGEGKLVKVAEFQQKAMKARGCGPSSFFIRRKRDLSDGSGSLLSERAGRQGNELYGFGKPEFAHVLKYLFGQ
jgi:hypothetical protein